jgi:hypothetical protein
MTLAKLTGVALCSLITASCSTLEDRVSSAAYAGDTPALLQELYSTPTAEREALASGAFFTACIKERFPTATALLDYVSVDTRDDDNDTPLLYAVKRKKLSMVKFLLQSGANVNAQGRGYHLEKSRGDKATYTATTDGPSATLLAVESGSQELLELILRSGGNPNVVCSHGSHARMYGRFTPRRFKKYLADGISITFHGFNAEDELSHMTPLLSATLFRRDLVETLMEAGADPDLPIPGAGSVRMVEALLQQLQQELDEN